MTGTEETENNMYMLYEAANKTPVYEVYQKLCKFRGNCDIDYVDFEQKYYRFYHGNSKLESAESSSSRTFSKLPIDIIKLIIDELELIDKLTLRKVSKELRYIVDDPKFVSSNVFISFEANISEFGLEENQIKYYDENGTSNYKITTRDSDGYTRKFKVKKRIIEEEHWETMIRDLSTIFEIPNWKFARIIWYFDAGVDEDKLTAPDILQKRIHLIERMLEASFLQVESISIFSTEHTAVMAILPNVIPGSLEFLGLNSDNNGAKLEDVVKLEQWKKLKRTSVENVSDSFPIEHFFHLESFSIYQIRFSEDRLVKIRDILFKSAEFWRCCLTSEIEDQVDVDGNREGISTLRELINAVNRIMGEHPEYNADTHCYSIPDSDKHFFVYPCEVYHSLQLKIKRVKNGEEDIDDSFEEFV